jgi:hypothetical protein
VPLGRSRRTLWLVADGAIAAAAFLLLAEEPVDVPATGRLFTGLLVATMAVAMADVVTDALIVDWGHAHGRAGRYQSAQWLSLYASGLIIGTAGGTLSAQGRITTAFLLSALAAAAMSVLAAIGVREPGRPLTETDPKPVADARISARLAMHELGRSARSPAVLSVAAFLFLWSFNPFAYTVLHVHMKDALGLGEQFYGDSLSMLSLSSIVAAAGSGLFSRGVSLRLLVHASVVLGILGSLAYQAKSDRRSALAVTLAVGFMSMTATLIQLELAARVCPPRAAGTVFASLMAVSNLSATLASWIGGVGYERLGAVWGRPAGFRFLVLIGAAATAACWLTLPLLSSALVAKAGQSEPPEGTSATTPPPSRDQRHLDT